MKKLFFLFVLLAFYSEADTQIHWMPLDSAVKKSETSPKKILLQFKTSWCMYCKLMEKKAFKDNGLIDYINNNFYPVQMDGEQKQPIVFKGVTYVLKGKGEYVKHEFTSFLLDKKLIFPSFVIFDEQAEKIGVIQEYMEAEDLENTLRYYSEDFYKTEELKNYKKRTKINNISTPSFR